MTIRTEQVGYTLDIDPACVDVTAFEAHLSRARHADLGERAAELRAALALWRGAPLGGVRGAEAEVARLEERRIVALDQRVEADLELGHHAQLVPELTGLLADSPLRERTRGQLMRALHGVGRTAEALAVFRAGRELLVEELGIEPGAELQRLHAAILAEDLVPEPSRPPAPVGLTQLPADVSDFTGREEQLQEVRRRLTSAQTAPPTVTISGRAGVGKTTLAVHTAHTAHDAFPDGRLFVNLRGFEAAPADPAAVLGRFLRYLGVDGSAIPDERDERQELYRLRLAGRRVLIVLDNAASESQVRPLLPGAPGCGVLVTSRRRLVLDGASPLDLDELPPDEAIRLMEAIAGKDRVSTEPEMAKRVVALCGHLPLAVRIAGARLVARPHWTIAGLAERLSDQRRRLDELAHGDREVRASVELSYQELDTDAALGFRLVGILDTPDAAPWIVAALLDTGLGAAQDILERLADARMLDVSGADAAGQTRYRLHDLLRIFAAEKAQEIPADLRSAALARVFGAALRLARVAEAAVDSPEHLAFRGSSRMWPDEAAAAILQVDPAAWIDAERANLVALTGRAADCGMSGYAWELTSSLTQSYKARGHLGDLLACAQRALDACRKAGDRRGEASALHSAALARSTMWCFDDAIRAGRSALAIFTEMGDQHGRAAALTGLSVYTYYSGHLAQARRLAEEALDSDTYADDPRLYCSTLRILGLVKLRENDIDAARACYEKGLRGYREIGSPRGEAETLRWMGALELAAGSFDEAIRQLRRAAAVIERSGDRLNAGLTKVRLGTALTGAGQHAEGRRLLEGCLAEFTQLGSIIGQAAAMRALANHSLHEGDHDTAISRSTEALSLLDALTAPVERAQVLRTLGKALHARGRRAEAARALAAAEDLLAEPSVGNEPTA